MLIVPFPQITKRILLFLGKGQMLSVQSFWATGCRQQKDFPRYKSRICASALDKGTFLVAFATLELTVGFYALVLFTFRALYAVTVVRPVGHGTYTFSTLLECYLNHPFRVSG